MRKKILMFSTIFMATLLLVGCGSAKLKNGEEVVFSVNGSKVSSDTLYKKLRNKYAKTLMIDVIDQKILDKVYKDDKEIQTQVSNSIESIKTQYKDNWEETLKGAGFNNESELEDYYRLSFERTKAIEDYIKEDITDKEIKKYYNENIVGDISCKHILISVKTEGDDSSTGLSDSEAKAKAEKIIKKLDKGEDFSKLAKENSDDTGSAEKGGDLGYFNKGEMVQEFEDAAYKLKKGKYTTKPVKTSYGYHIILKTDEKEKPTLKKAKDTVIEKLIEQKKKDEPTIEVTALEKLRKEYKLKFKDAKLKKLYKEYIKEQKESAEKSASSSQN